MIGAHDALRWVAESQCSRRWQPSTSPQCRRSRPSTRWPWKPPREADLLRSPCRPRRQTAIGHTVRRDTPRWQKDATLLDRVPDKPVTYPFKELTVRLRRGRCELCQQPGKVQVHQIRKLAWLEPPGADQPTWAKVIVRKRRKTPRGLPFLPRHHPQPAPHHASGVDHSKASCLERGPGGSAGGHAKRACTAGTSPHGLPRYLAKFGDLIIPDRRPSLSRVLLRRVR
jgi:hypothetical protein